MSGVDRTAPLTEKRKEYCEIATAYKRSPWHTLQAVSTFYTAYDEVITVIEPRLVDVLVEPA
jgi:hypothetical protein